MKGNRSDILHVLYEKPGPKAKDRIAVATILSVVLLGWLVVAIVLRFERTGQLSAKYWSFFLAASTWRFIGAGLLGTMKVALSAGLITYCLGFLLMLGRLHKGPVLSRITAFLIAFSRGTPTLLFVYFFFLAAPQLGIRLPAFWKITLSVSISAAGVVAEVLRSGVNAVPRGQSEAAVSLGMRSWSVFLKVVFPQAMRMVIPALIAEIVIVLKDTTFAYVVNYADLMQNARVLISNHDAMLSVYLVVAVIYILINYLLGCLASSISRRQKSPVPSI